MALGMQNGFNVSELAVAAITAGFDGYLNASAINAVRAAEASDKTLEAASMVEKMTHVAESVVLRQLSELALGQRSKFDFTAAGIDIAVAYANQKISDKLDADTYAANPKAKSGDLVANHMTAAAVSTAMAEVLGSAVKHQPLNVANTAANAIGAAIGTGIGSTFADQLDAHYQQAEKGVQYTKQARHHSASMRTPTAAEQHAPGARSVAKPKPAARAYNPYNDPEVLKAEAVANMSLPSASLVNPDVIGKQQAIYNASAAQHQNWQVDHSFGAGITRGWQHIEKGWANDVQAARDFQAPSLVSPGLALMMQAAPTLLAAFQQPVSTGFNNIVNRVSSAKHYVQNLWHADADELGYAVAVGSYETVKFAAQNAGPIMKGTGLLLGKLGTFATAGKLASAMKLSGASKLAFGGMFGRTVEVGGDVVNDVVGKGLATNPFKGKSFEEIDKILTARGYKKIGPNPVEGKGSYFHSKTGRKYYLDKGGVYKEGIELPHVDVHRMKNGINLEKVGKRRYPIGNNLIEENINTRGYNANF